MKQKLQRLQRLALQGRVTRIPEPAKVKGGKQLARMYITPAEALAHGGGFVPFAALAKSVPPEPHVMLIERTEVLVTPSLSR
jgi:hypothetical protein